MTWRISTVWSSFRRLPIWRGRRATKVSATTSSSSPSSTARSSKGSMGTRRKGASRVSSRLGNPSSKLLPKWAKIERKTKLTNKKLLSERPTYRHTWRLGTCGANRDTVLQLRQTQMIFLNLGQDGMANIRNSGWNEIIISISLLGISVPSHPVWRFMELRYTPWRTWAAIIKKSLSLHEKNRKGFDDGKIVKNVTKMSNVFKRVNI